MVFAKRSIPKFHKVKEVSSSVLMFLSIVAKRFCSFLLYAYSWICWQRACLWDCPSSCQTCFRTSKDVGRETVYRRFQAIFGATRVSPGLQGGVFCLPKTSWSRLGQWIKCRVVHVSTFTWQYACKYIWRLDIREEDSYSNTGEQFGRKYIINVLPSTKKNARRYWKCY